jgi:hypothetical protein
LNSNRLEARLQRRIVWDYKEKVTRQINGMYVSINYLSKIMGWLDSHEKDLEIMDT